MKILVVFTGGTIGSCYNDGVISPDSNTRYKLIEMYKQNGGCAEFDAISPYTVLSENLNGEYFNLLYNSVKENINNYDGIIVTHGTDTLQYTSAVLSYMFGFCNTPIVLVSANYPLESEKSNGLENFSAAVDFIKSGNNKGVFVAYKITASMPKFTVPLACKNTLLIRIKSKALIIFTTVKSLTAILLKISIIQKSKMK